LEETGDRAAWHNQLKGCMTKRRNGRHEIRNRKLTTSQLILYFLFRKTEQFKFSSDEGDTLLDKPGRTSASFLYTLENPIKNHLPD
jgi:hypothetical protein